MARPFAASRRKVGLLQRVLLAFVALAVLAANCNASAFFFTAVAPAVKAPGPSSAAGAGLPASPEASVELVKEVRSVEEYRQMIDNGPGAVVAVFTSPYCGPCLLAEPLVEAIAAEFAPQLQVIKLKLFGPTTKAFKAISDELDVRVLPSFIVYKHGEVVGSVSGTKVMPGEGGSLTELRDLVRQQL